MSFSNSEKQESTVDNKEKADKSPPINFDELNNRLIMTIVHVEQQSSDILALSTRVAELERRSGTLK